MKQHGLVIASGPTGSGKSTSLATMINHINHHRTCHVVTIEDPIEYTHNNIKSAITQRQLGTDTLSFATALKHVLRQDPDVILVGEMRDLETAQAALTVAETGHLVLTTGHATGAPEAIDRVVGLFPPAQRYLAQTGFRQRSSPYWDRPWYHVPKAKGALRRSKSCWATQR